MRTLRSLVVTLVGTMAVVSVVAAAQGPAVPDVRAFVHQVYIEGVPYEQAIRLDPTSGVPVLLGMLADPREEKYWPNIVATLGMLGDDRATDELIRFLERDIPGRPLSHPHYIAKTTVMMALGYIANKSGSPRALAYLKDSLSPGVWAARGINWISPYHATAEERNHQLSKMAILGLALSGDASAAEALRSLQRPASTDADRRFQEKMRHVVSEALSAHAIISRHGLLAYYRNANATHCCPR
jgi:HEAT repeat protein